MKYKGVTPTFKCAMQGVEGHTCSPERARWPEKGYWADVCLKAMEDWLSRLNAATRSPWSGMKREVKQ